MHFSFFFQNQVENTTNLASNLRRDGWIKAMVKSHLWASTVSILHFTQCCVTCVTKRKKKSLMSKIILSVWYVAIKRLCWVITLCCVCVMYLFYPKNLKLVSLEAIFFISKQKFIAYQAPNPGMSESMTIRWPWLRAIPIIVLLVQLNSSLTAFEWEASNWFINEWQFERNMIQLFKFW